jgi:hypothetical protein
MPPRQLLRGPRGLSHPQCEKGNQKLGKKIKEMKIPKLIVLFAASVALAPFAQAQSTLLGWNFSSNSAWTQTAPTGTVQSVASHLTLTQNWKWGSGVNGLSTAAGSAWGASSWAGQNSNAAAAAASGDFVSFSVTVETGYALSFSSISPYNVRRSNTGPTTGQWQYSVDGTNFVDIGSTITWGSNTSSSGNAQTAGVNLSSVAGLQNIAGGTTVTFRVVGWGATGTGNWYFNSHSSVANPNLVFMGSVVPAVANSSILNAPTTASVGRVMQGSSTTTNVTVTRTGTGDANYSTATNNATAPATGTISGASGSVGVGVDTTQTGAQTGTVTLTNTSNAADTAPNKTITVSGTVVANREIEGTADAGKVFVGSAVSGTATISTHGDSDHYTNVTVNGNAVTQGNASVSAGETTLFDNANATTDREITGTFTQSGNGQTLSVNLNVTGEGLAGENAQATASIRADVYQHASLVANTNEVLDDGGFVTVENEFSSDGGQRAAADISSKTTTGAGWSSTDFEGGSTPGSIAESEQVTANVAFDRTNKLNGTHVGSLVVGFQDEAGIAGGGSLGNKTWKLSTEVSGNTAQAGVAQVATVLSGNSYAGFSTTLNGSSATQVALRAGIASATKDISVTFSDINPGALAGVANDADRVAAIVSLEGSGTDTIVLELSYSDIGVINESDLALVWLADGSDTWTLATTGNTGAGALAGAYAMSYDEFLAANGGVFNATTMLGAYGVDIETNTVWAIVNHNSDFSVALNAVPEPTAAGLIAVGSLLAFARRRRTER